MLKQLASGIKKVLAILLAVLFVASVTEMAVNAHGGGRVGFGWGGYGGWGYGPGCMWVGGNNWLCPAFSGMPYTIQTTAPAAPSPNLAGVAIFPEPTPTNSTSK
jgi:hypothetical protein